MGEKNMHDDFKLIKLKTKYSFHQFFRRIQMSYFWFFLSICLSLFILFPSLLHSIPVAEMISQNGIFQYRLSLSGQLVFPEDATIQYPITVAVGGYSQQITTGTDFSLVFLAAKKSNIPIVISDESGRYIVKHITFDSNSMDSTFYFNGPSGD